MGIKRTFYTESGFNLVPMAFPPMPFSKKNVLGTRLGVIVVDVYIADLLLLSQETWKILTPKGREEYDWTVSNHVHTFAGEDYWTRFLCFFCFDIVFIKSSKMPPDCCFFCFCFCFFLYLYPPDQCAPSHLSIFNLPYHPPSLPTVPPLLLQAVVLKGVKFLSCILISEKLSPSTFSLNS